MNLDPNLNHDRRCEQPDVLVEERGRCRCAARAAAKALTLECGTATAIGHEATTYGHIGDIITDTLDRSTRKLMAAVSAQQRVPLPMTLHLISTNDPYLDASTLRLAVLTVPHGTTLDDSLLEVADDWMRAQGLRR